MENVEVYAHQVQYKHQPGRVTVATTTAPVAGGHLKTLKNIFPTPRLRLRIWSHETCSSFYFRVSHYLLRTVS